MAWKEKTAWLSLISMLVAYGVYFSLVWVKARPLLDEVVLFAGVTIVQIIAVSVIAAVLATAAGSEATAPADERDKSIARRGASAAYYVLLVLVFAVGALAPLVGLSGGITNIALAAMVTAEASRHVVIVASYRGGWHG